MGVDFRQILPKLFPIEGQSRPRKIPQMNRSEISLKASQIAGAAWDDRSKTGTLAEQLTTVADWRNMGTDGDLTDADRAELRKLAAKAAKL